MRLLPAAEQPRLEPITVRIPEAISPHRPPPFTAMS